MSCSIFLHLFGVFDKAIKCFKTDGEDCPLIAIIWQKQKRR
ncbi:hypothetical protein [uncultured Gammaproteobacteria bacterium]|nr:hypothetical protein [uncultured Gammaproteobacteria bacterium]